MLERYAAIPSFNLELLGHQKMARQPIQRLRARLDIDEATKRECWAILANPAFDTPTRMGAMLARLRLGLISWRL